MSKAVANLTQSTETITFSAQDNGETISVNITEAARGPAGAAGAAGPNSVTSATTSDGTANLSLSSVTTATAEVTSTLIANHIHGNLAGSVYAHVRAGENLAKGDPVYISGSHGSGSTLIAIVSKADASDPLKMPAVGVMDAAVTANANGHMVITGTISDINTATYSVNSELYVAEGGGFTANPPRDYAQPVARVERSNTNNGAVIVKVNGLSAIAETPQTLVRRDTAGSVEAYSLRVATDPFTGFTTTLEANNDGSLESAVVLTLPLKSGYLATTGNSDGVVDITHGGTNATTASSARTNLGLGTGDTPSFSGLTLTNALALASGGTGATSAANARTNLGLGTASTPTFANLTLACGTITTSQPFAITETWNASGVTFKAIDIDVTDTASASGSLLMDLRVGGVTKFGIDKSGNPRVTSSFDLKLAAIDNYAGLGASTFAVKTGTSPNNRIGLDGLQLYLQSQGIIGWNSSTTNCFSASDLILSRDAANTLAQRNGTNAQVTRVYDTYTSATDYHRLAIATARATATAMSGATITLTNIIPAGAVVVGVTCKVTTAITGATSFKIGTALDDDRFGAAIGIALGTTSDNRDWTVGTIECFPTATSLILTANGSNFTAGAVYVSVQYLSGQAD